MSTKTYLDDIYKKSDPLYVVNNQTLKKAKNNAKNNANTTNTSATTTQTTNTSATKPTGVDDASWQTANSKYSASNNQNKLDSTVQSDLSNFKNLASNKNIISNGTWNDINSSFVVPSEVLEADRYLADQLQKIQSGKTSYSDQVRDMMDKIMNREKFSYDVDSDPLFQQALASAMNSGKQAMQDTIGQASALTGGYGSSYATTAGNQAYNAYIEDAYDNLPQYYQMALEAYQMEGDDMYRQYSMLSTEDDKEYNRNITAYDATYQYRNQKYNDAYTQYRDAKSDAFAMANLELSENSQIVNNAYNMYQASSNYADSMYQREYKTWLDSVNQAWQAIQMQNSDYWSKTNFDESVRQFDTTFAEDVRQFDTTFAEDVRQFDTTFAENQRQYNERLAEDKRQFDVVEANKLKMHDDQMSYNYSALAQDQSQHDAQLAHEDKWNQMELDYKYTALNSGGSGGRGGSNSSGEKLKTPTISMYDKVLKAFNSGDMNAYNAELNAALQAGYDVDSLTSHVADYGDAWVEDYHNYMNGIKINDDTVNGGGGEDHNDVYTYTSPKNGETYTRTYDQLKTKITGMDMPKEKQDELLDMLKKQSKR